MADPALAARIVPESLTLVEVSFQGGMVLSPDFVMRDTGNDVHVLPFLSILRFEARGAGLRPYLCGKIVSVS